MDVEVVVVAMGWWWFNGSSQNLRRTKKQQTLNSPEWLGNSDIIYNSQTYKHTHTHTRTRTHTHTHTHTLLRSTLSLRTSAGPLFTCLQPAKVIFE